MIRVQKNHHCARNDNKTVHRDDSNENINENEQNYFYNYSEYRESNW